MTAMAPLHERLHFDTAHGRVLDGPRRYVLLRVDVLTGLFDALPDDARAAALRAFGASVTRFGGDSVRAYAQAAGREALLATVRDAAASLGWGRWRFDDAGDTLRLEVHDSPFATGTAGRGPACHAIAGMLEAVAGALWTGGASARELACAADTATDAGDHRCRFEARPVSSKPPGPTAHWSDSPLVQQPPTDKERDS